MQNILDFQYGNGEYNYIWSNLATLSVIAECIKKLIYMHPEVLKITTKFAR
jgi:hypothetical protein